MKNKIKSSLFLKWKNIINIIFILIILSVSAILSYKMFYFMQDIPLKAIYVKGASPHVERAIEDRVSFIKNNKIAQIDIDKLQEYIESLPWVYKSSIFRNLSGYLTIHIIEITPYLLWQNDEGDYKLINSENKISKVDLNFPLSELITIEGGTKALNKSDDIRFLIYSDLEVLQKIKTLDYNGYRWNMILKNGIIIKLPEKEIDLAYQKFLSLNKKYNLLEQNIQYIDVTSVNKLFIMPNNS